MIINLFFGIGLLILMWKAIKQIPSDDEEDDE